MAAEWIKKEQEFLRLNAELEKRTREMMHRVDSVMNLNKFLPNHCVDIHELNKEQPACKNKDSNAQKTHDTIAQVQQEDDDWSGLPEGCQNMGQRGLTQFLKTRVKVLQNDLDIIKTKYRNKLNSMKQLETEHEQLQEDRNKWKRIAETNKDQNEKLSNQLTMLQSKVQTKETLITNVKRDYDNITKQLTSVNASYANQDIRLNKTMEELDRVKSNLRSSKKNEKDLRENHRKEIAVLTALNKKLEKQTAELSTGFKKQLLLIDNLKKQKTYLESAKITDMIEEEFLKVLDWKPTDVARTE